MIVFKRKQAVLVVVVCMILVAGYINWAYQSSAPVSDTSVALTGASPQEEEVFGQAALVNASVSSQDVVASARETRDNARNKSIEMLNETVNNPTADAEAKKAAQTELTAIAAAAEKEGICEGLIETKLGKSVVFISNGNVSVSVQTDAELNEADIAKAVDVVVTHTGISADKIKVSKIK